ncbi:hypothetical protein JCM4814A_93740 [Streptomyces phaeofaciens JCM 4814]|uniref:Uncharacterized protein n=1 Tax=Streptomyces phaeofaciens TaxID=68254 RepID=A0A918M0U9_9ACTN|nr:hypothetical protein GCM10010226_89340 [Streptomyces phaeofaciens]
MPHDSWGRAERSLEFPQLWVYIRSINRRDVPATPDAPLALHRPGLPGTNDGRVASAQWSASSSPCCRSARAVRPWRPRRPPVARAARRTARG